MNMPRSNWKGVISFGLVSIPIILYPSENKEADISFHQIDKRDNARIKYQRINSETGKVVPWEKITRGYEYDKETTIPVPDEVLKKVAGDDARMINILTFINKSELNILSFDRSYYIVPDKGGNKGYNILHDALEQTKKIGIAKVIISTKEYLAAVMPYEHALILYLLKYNNEIKSLDEFDSSTKNTSKTKANKKEIQMAKTLIQSMSSKWQPKKYKDKYQELIHQWIEESANKRPHTIKSKRSHTNTNAINFVDLLKKSLSAKPKSAKKSPRKMPKIVKPKHKGKHITHH